MADVDCPYCGEGTEINHDDGYGYGEDVTYEQECGACEKTFAYHTSIHFHHSAEKADCLNGAPHNYKAVSAAPTVFPDWVRCRDCDHEVRGEYHPENHPSATPPAKSTETQP